MRHRRGLSAIAAVGLLGVLAACSSSSSAGSSAGGSASGNAVTNVVLGYSNANIINWATVRMAYDSSYCAPYGVKVTPEVLNPTSAVAAIESGQVNFIATGSVVTAVAKGTVHNEKLVAYLGLNAPDEVAGLWASPGINSAKDLIGKTIGASSPTSPTYLGAVALLQHEGISASQVHFVFLSSESAVLAALAHGTISATWNNGPLPAANTAAKDHIAVPLTDDPGLDSVDSQFLTGNQSFMTQHPAAAKGFLECLAAATKGGRSTDAATLNTYQTLLAKQTGDATLSKETWPEYPIAAGVMPMDSTSEKVLSQSLTLQLGKTVSASDVASWADTTPMTGVTAVPIVNSAGTSQYAAYSGK
ncbi:MAG TPA: ABC transporter substrate-binding protein [Trebonia sp.]|nr:ABC transporter substrate-binding protein [Trebonia sp.]